jgi:hypothetical protein
MDIGKAWATWAIILAVACLMVGLVLGKLL